MKKHHSVQGTISRLFGKKQSSSNSPTTSLYVTNPPWIFTQEVASDSLARSGQYGFSFVSPFEACKGGKGLLGKIIGVLTVQFHLVSLQMDEFLEVGESGKLRS